MDKIGVIEGFYGIPYSFDQRYDLIDFLSHIGMNAYIYAPKDDPYHNISWREPYPKEELEKLAGLSNFAKDKKVDFIWAIHPGQNLIDFNKYEEELPLLLGKYKSLYDKGIRSFALCMDDVDRDKAYEQRDYHLRLVEDILDFIKDFDNNELFFVHPWYNEAWIDQKARGYFDKFNDLGRLRIMWTGADVVVPISKDANEKFIDLAKAEPEIWFNWPVNDYKRDEIFMEVFEFYDSSNINYRSLFSNPMNQAELSKISIYQLGEFLKDPHGYDPEKVFKKALAYVDESVAGELFILADSFFGSGVYKRTENKKFVAEKDIKRAYELKDKFLMKEAIEKKLAAIDSYFDNYTNKNLHDEIRQFLLSLSYLLLAIRERLDGNDLKARSYYKKREDFKVKVYKEDSNDQIELRKVKVSESLEEIYKNLEGKTL
ncbi:MAG: beta-N-acetylglucosaminidase domain-containing protein [Anaerococcus sp.]|nr:beta-N-acetylglucosaminidase domain-containing protein [Anaerococcus sp.]